MIRRSSRILLELLAALLAGFAVLVGIGAWRLSQEEPLRLEFLTPYLERALAAPDGSFTVDIDSTVLTWAGWDRTFDLRASGVHVIGANGRTVANIPEMAVTLSVRALLRGLIAPTAFEIFGPHLFLERDIGGRLRFVHAAAADSLDPGDTTSAIVPPILGSLLQEPDPTQPTGYLTRVDIADGKLTFVDRIGGYTWFMPEVTLELVRDPSGISGRLDLEMDRIGNPARLSAELDFDRSDETLKMTGKVTGIEANALGLLEPGLQVLKGAELTLDGSITSSISIDGYIGDTRFDITSRPGRINLPAEFAAPVIVEHATVQGVIESNGDRLTVENAILKLDGPTLEASGRLLNMRSGLNPLSPGILFEGQLACDNLPIGDVARFWPRSVGRNAREWVVENMTAGRAEQVQLNMRLLIPGADPEAATIELLEGSLRGAGMTIHYLAPMPPIEDAAGTAHFTHREFTAEFGGGHLGAISIEGGKLRIGDLDKPDQIVEVGGSTRGPLAEAVALLDHPRLGYASRLGLSPADTAGDFTAQLSFKFPAIRDLTFDKVAIDVAAEISNGQLARLLLDRDLTNANLKLRLDQKAMNVAGTGSFAGIPLDLEWEENFSGGDFIRRISAAGIVSPAQRAELGFDVRPALDGPIGADLVFAQLPKDRAKVAAKFDLLQATLELPFVAWRKNAGVPGAASLTADVVAGRLSAIPEFAVAAGDLSATGAATFAEAGDELKHVEFASLNIGRSNLRGVAADLADGLIDVSIAGGELDAGPLLAPDAAIDPSAPTAQAGPTGRAFSLRAGRLDKVLLGDDRYLQDVVAQLRHDGQYWDEIRVEARLQDQQPLTLVYEPVAGGKHRLAVDSTDAGGVLRAFDIARSLKGGVLKIVGEADDAKPERPLIGKAEIADFRVVDAPVLARLLTLATLTGFVDALTGEGFQFDRFKSDYTKTGGRLEIDKARAYGPSIGLTGTGFVDFDSNTLNISGTIVPAYAVNSLLGNIPLIGKLLQGGEGEGMFAATYTMSGPLAEPAISVNPLAAIAPGFLRELFEAMEGNGGSSSGKGTAPSPTPRPNPRGSNK